MRLLNVGGEYFCHDEVNPELILIWNSLQCLLKSANLTDSTKDVSGVFVFSVAL